jgi:Flp pilus assembly protein TadB
MIILDFVSRFESAQVVAVFGIGALVLALVIMGRLNAHWRAENAAAVKEREWKESVADKELERREHALRLQDEMAESEHKRKSEWHLLTTKPTLIDRKR